MGTIVKDTTIILQTARKMGWNVDFCGQFASYSTAVAEAPGEPAEGFYSMSPALYAYPDDPRPAVQAFTSAYRKTFGIDVNYLGEAGYTAATFIVAVAGQGRPRPDAGQLHRRDGKHEGLARHLRRTAAVDEPDQPSRVEPVVPVGGERQAVDPGGGRAVEFLASGDAPPAGLRSVGMAEPAARRLPPPALAVVPSVRTALVWRAASSLKRCDDQC